MMTIKIEQVVERVRHILDDAGLVPGEHIDLSGNMALCGTTRKPHGTDGRYKVHMDFPPTLWLCNHHDDGVGRTFPLYDKSELDAMPAAERAALRERIRQQKLAAQKEREERQQKAAREAQELFQGFAPAGEENGYLCRKGVRPAGDLRETRDGRLVVPVMNGEGSITSLQYLADDGDKRFLKGGKVEGGFFPVPAEKGAEEGSLLIGEGIATMLSACMATGYAGLVAFNAGNLLTVAKAARARHPERTIILLADNDCAFSDGRKREGESNTGVFKATEAARAIGARLAVCPALEERSTDFNDLHIARGLDAVREAAEAADVVTAEACTTLPAGFYIVEKGRNAGLWKTETKGDDVQEFQLGPPLKVLGRTRDEQSKNWGVLLEWNDPAGVVHRTALADELLQRQGNDWAAMLAADGYSVAPGMHSRFKTFLAGIRTGRFITNTAKVGWYQTCFVLPDVTIGAEDGLVVLQSLDCVGSLYQTAGTLEGWQKLARLCAGNSRFTFSLCAGLAGPLLKLAGLEGGGFSFEGASSCGKTTCLQIAASEWGGPCHVRTWRTTSNGLEAVASLHNDGLLVLDEVGQATGRDLAEVSYMLANGAGKVRAGRSGGARASASWRLLFLSSGELGLADKLGEDGLKSRAGQEVRYVGIPVGKEDIADLHGLSSAGELVRQVKETAERHYGHASRKFLGWIVRELDAVKSTLPDTVTAIAAELCPEDACEQVRRVAMRFAIVRIAGTLAKQAGVLPADIDEKEAVRRCFAAWLANRGTLGASEDAAILSAVQLFIDRNGASRFQDIGCPETTCVNRAGFRRCDGERIVYLIMPEVFRVEVAKGFSASRAASVLHGAGWLDSEVRNGKQSFLKRVTVPGNGRRTYYVISIPDDEDQELNQGM